jgi:hypothetical protein
VYTNLDVIFHLAQANAASVVKMNLFHYVSAEILMKLVEICGSGGWVSESAMLLRCGQRRERGRSWWSENN